MSIRQQALAKCGPILWLLAALACGGCTWSGSTAPTTAPASSGPAKAAQTSVQPSEQPATATASAHGQSPPEQPADASHAENPADAATIAQPPTFGTERVLLLTPKSPLIVEFQLSIDGLPHTQALDRLVAEVLKVADTDGDGRPTWKEVAESKRFKYGQFGNVAINNDNDLKQVIEKYDSDRDGTVDAAELPRFLTRNAGSARAFSVRGTADYRAATGRPPLWRLLDTDGDGSLSAAERAAAPAQLLIRDSNDDEVLVSGELDSRIGLDPNMMNERRRLGPTLIRLLGPYADWDSIRASLEREYAGEGYLRPDSFPLTPDLFGRLDKNHDGKLLKTEFPGLNDVPPHVVIAVPIGQHASQQEGEATGESKDAAAADPATTNQSEMPKMPPAPQVRLVSIVPELAGSEPSVTEQAGRLTIRVGGTPITFYINDTVAGGNFQAQAQQALMMLDADKNGYLEEKEIPAGAAPQFGQFAAVDADGDGKVYPAEIAAFLEQQQAGLRAQIHVKASDREDALFAVLDQDHDERLDAREIDQAPQRLAELDRNGDGLITADEVSESLVVGLARGNLENMDALFVPPPLVARAPAADTPRWFTAMDANGDGAIGRREFLGPPEKFQALDANGDGLLDLSEAKAAAEQTSGAGP